MYEYNLKLILDYNIDSDVDWTSDDNYSEAFSEAIDDLKDDSIYDLKNKLLAESKKQQVKAKLAGDVYDNQGDENFALNDLYTSIGILDAIFTFPNPESYESEIVFLIHFPRLLFIF